MKINDILLESPTVHHGSDNEISQFNLTKLSTDYQHSYGWGVYFASNPDETSGYGSTLHTIDIPDTLILIDWDKPLNAQPDSIQTILHSNADKFKTYHKYIEDMPWDKVTGGSLYSSLRSELRGQKPTSHFLNSMGIHGTTYISKGMGDKTDRNYVIWDQNILDGI